MANASLPNVARVGIRFHYVGAHFFGVALALLCLPACSGSSDSANDSAAVKSKDADIKQRVNPPYAWKHRATGYAFEIGYPRGFSTAMQDHGKMYWRGDTYKSASGASVLREFRVFLRKTSAPTTVKQALKQALDKIKAEQVHLEAGDMETLQLGGLSFLRCDFQFTSKRNGRGNGFLYTAVDGDVTITINAEEYDGGKPERLSIAHASAQTFHNGKVRGPGAIRRIPRK